MSSSAKYNLESDSDIEIAIQPYQFEPLADQSESYTNECNEASLSSEDEDDSHRVGNTEW